MHSNMSPFLNVSPPTSGQRTTKELFARMQDLTMNDPTVNAKEGGSYKPGGLDVGATRILPLRYVNV